MDISKNRIIEIVQNTGFIKDNIEKLLRLIDILEFIFTTKYKDLLVLKGGTCINVIYRDVDRLSVDIDLDYIGKTKGEMLKDKEDIKSFLSKSLFAKNYALSSNSRESYGLSSLVFQYTNNSGNIDNIKIEINYLDRVHIFPIEKRIINNKIYKGSTPIRILNITELYATKINALINRAKARDLFDTYQMINSNSIIDTDNLRKAIIFYNSIGGDLDLLTDDICKSIDGILKTDIERQLKPMLTRYEKVNLDEMRNIVNKYLIKLMLLNDEERKFLTDLKEGIFLAEKLFPDYKDISNHPMIEYRLNKRVK